MQRVWRGAALNSAQRRGFTLIELLVVMAVITVLMGLLLPVLGLARAQAKRIACASNLKQLGTAWVMYLDDSDGYFYKEQFAHYNFGGWPGDDGWWPRPLNRFAGLPGLQRATEREARVFSCPADRGGNPDSEYKKFYKLVGTSYFTNKFLVGPNTYSGNENEPNETFIRIAKKFVDKTHQDQVDVSPSLVLLMGDSGWFWQWDRRVTGPHRTECAQLERGLWHRKKEHFNIAFLDGHVGFTRIEKGRWGVPGQYSILPLQRLIDTASPYSPVSVDCH